MAERPSDWSPLADRDPVPGRHRDTSALTSHFQAVGSAITTCQAQVEQLAEPNSMEQGKSIDALRDECHDLAEALLKAVERYTTTHEALGAYLSALDEHQETTRRALIDAQDAQADLDAATARTQSLSAQPAPTSATAADAHAADLSASGAAAREAQSRIDAARRRMETARDLWDAAGERAARLIEEVIDGDGLQDRWYDDQTLRNVSGALGQVLWDAGPGTIGDLSALAGWLIPGDDWAEAFADWISGGQDSLENWWGTDTSSDTFKSVWIVGTLVVLLIPVVGQGRAAAGYGARGASRGAAVLDEARTAEDLKAGAWDALWQMLPWYQPPLEGDDLTAEGYLQGPAYLPGALGDDFAPGIVGSFGTGDIAEKETAVAEVLVAHGDRVDSRYQPDWIGSKNPDAMVRGDGGDVGTPTEFKTLTSNPKSAQTTAENAIKNINDQLNDWGGGDGVIDGRAAGLTAEQAEDAVSSVLSATALQYGKTWKMADQYTFLVADGTTLVVHVDDLKLTKEVL